MWSLGVLGYLKMNGIIGLMVTGHESPAVHVLLVEDTPFDVRVFRRAIDRSRRPCRLSVAGNGEEALDFLQRAGQGAGADLPDIIVLDLNMPRLSGIEFLETLRARSWAPSRLPVIVYTTSDLPADRHRCEAQGVVAYVLKSEPAEHVLDLVQKAVGEAGAV